jgi:hypothetical protein
MGSMWRNFKNTLEEKKKKAQLQTKTQKRKNKSIRKTSDMSTVPSNGFCGEYHGHLVPHLTTLHASLRTETSGLVWLAGDSSLDNKHWIDRTVPAPARYADVLRPPRTRPDVACLLTAQMERGDTSGPCVFFCFKNLHQMCNMFPSFYFIFFFCVQIRPKC